VTKTGVPYRASPDDTGVAFLQGGGRGGRGGHDGRGGQGDKNDGDKTEGGNDDVSTMTGKTSGDGAQTNSKGESHCFNCGSPSHWAYECPQLSGEQQAQLHMNQEAQEDTAKEQADEEGHQMMHVTFSQGGELLDDRAYLDGCLTMTAFKSKKFLENLRQVNGGIKINCNAGAVSTDVKGDFGGMSVWYLPDGIANIFSMHELEKLYRITYDSWEGFYVVQPHEVRCISTRMSRGYPTLTWPSLAMKLRGCSCNWWRRRTRTTKSQSKSGLPSCRQCAEIMRGTRSGRYCVPKKRVKCRHCSRIRARRIIKA